MTPQETFVGRLRRHRQRNGITLEEVGTATRVPPELFEAFENNDLKEWPRGLYARAWVRGYATAVGLDPGDTVDEFCRLFPHGDRRAKATFREMAAIVSERSGYRDEFSLPEDRRAPRGVVAPKPVWYGGVVAALRAGWQRVAAWQSVHGSKKIEIRSTK
jgi:cytoskeletal protein RodZ